MGKKISITSWGSIVIGILLVFFALQMRYLTNDMGMAWKDFSITFLINFGIAIFIFGFFSVVIDTKNWREYFAERLKEIVIEQKYLDKMEEDTLKNLQIKIMKALSGGAAVDREGSFLNYFNDNLHRYISEPYREDVSAEIFLREEVDGGLKIFDKVTYYCRRLGKNIQENVKWSPDKDEFLRIESAKVEVQYPDNHQKSDLIESLSNDPEEIARGISLEKYKDIDRLTVIVTSVYIVSTERFQYWQMAHPTRNFNMTINYPKDFSIQSKILVLNPAICQITEQPGYLKVKYDSWMLPMSGIAWRFLKKTV